MARDIIWKIRNISEMLEIKKLNIKMIKSPHKEYYIEYHSNLGNG